MATFLFVILNLSQHSRGMAERGKSRSKKCWKFLVVYDSDIPGQEFVILHVVTTPAVLLRLT